MACAMFVLHVILDDSVQTYHLLHTCHIYHIVNPESTTPSQPKHIRPFPPQWPQISRTWPSQSHGSPGSPLSLGSVVQLSVWLAGQANPLCSVLFRTIAYLCRVPRFPHGPSHSDHCDQSYIQSFGHRIPVHARVNVSGIVEQVDSTILSVFILEL